VAAYFEADPNGIAAAIIEPIAGNMGLVLPDPEFLHGLRRLTQHYGALLIFDEVITGFRVGRGGAQKLYKLTPDLTCLGKVVGGGMPLAAVGGKHEIMDQLAPIGPVYQAGTLSGNPLAVTAGIETLKIISTPGTYDRLNELGTMMAEGLRQAVRDTGTVACVNQIGSMFTLFFGVNAVHDSATATQSDTKAFARYFQGMIERGVYLPPSQFETAFISLAHSQAEVQETVTAAKEVLRGMR
jgi:glutamate-1-semialdehyde 2,1-aminomutase